MIVSLLLFVLVLAAPAAFVAGRWGPRWPRWISLGALLAALALVVAAAVIAGGGGAGGTGRSISEFDRSWIPAFGIRFHLAIDGLSLVLLGLTVLLGLAAVLASWAEIRERVGLFHLCLLGVLAGVVGVFTAVDLFLFYFFWELMLIPMYFLIVLWGHEDRRKAALKFFIFTQASGLFMLAAILTLFSLHLRATGVATFDAVALRATPLSPSAARWLALGFTIAFVVKLPALGFHTWLPDAHTEAPTAGSVLLAGLLLKTGAYGLLRFVVGLFPDAAEYFAPAAWWLGAAGILYGAVMAFAQRDLKRLVAYSSVSHLGFVLLGVFALERQAVRGAVLQMVCHGISTGALFILVGGLQKRLHTRDLDRLGGLWSAAPVLGGLTLLFSMASLGLPGLGNFLAEFLVLYGSFSVALPAAVMASAGLVLGAVYSLRLFQGAFHGPEGPKVRDLGPRDLGVLAALAVAIVWLGLHPQPVLAAAGPALDHLLAALSR